MSFYNLRPFLNWFLMIAAITGVIYIGYSQGNSSNIMRIATGERGSYLHDVGKELKQAIENNSDYKVELVVSKGSVFNRGVLQSGQAEVAILSPAVSDMTNLTVVAPIAKNYVQVIVNVDSKIDSMDDLAGHRISLGGLTSDHRRNAVTLLNYYHIEPKTLRNTETSHLSLLEGRELDGAIITTSVKDPYLRKLMASGNFKLLGINAYEGIAATSSFLSSEIMSSGTYPSIAGPQPKEWLSMITTDSLIVTRVDAQDLMVETLLTTLFTKDFQKQYPLLSEWKAKTQGEWSTLESHEAAKRYFNPYLALKEAIFSAMLVLWNIKWVLLCVIIFLISARARWVDHKERVLVSKQESREQRIQKLIEDINEHEQLQADTKDYRLLMLRLSETRKIKQDGINVAAVYHMSNSPIFLAFLGQCDHVIQDIQWKLSIGVSRHSDSA